MIPTIGGPDRFAQEGLILACWSSRCPNKPICFVQADPGPRTCLVTFEDSSVSGRCEQILTILAGSDNEAADQALGFALLADRGSHTCELASALLHRGTEDAVSYLVRAYHKLDRHCQQNLVDQGHEISSALRLAIKDRHQQTRDNAIDLMTACGQPKLAYILTVLLHDEVPAIRTRSAEAMRDLAEKLLADITTSAEFPEHGPGDHPPQTYSTDGLKEYCVALGAALDRFAVHLRTEVIEAAMELAPYLPDDVWARIIEPGSRPGRAAVELFQRDTRRSFAGFAFRALTSEGPGKSIAKFIAAERSGSFMSEWLNFSWYRFDRMCRKNLARIRNFQWIGEDAQPLLEMPGELQIRFIDVLWATAVPTERKLQILGNLLAAKDHTVQEYVVGLLVKMNTADANDYLSRAASLSEVMEFSPKASRIAARHLQRADTFDKKQPGLGGIEEFEDLDETELSEEQRFERFWKTFDTLDTASCRTEARKLRRSDCEFIERVKEKSNSPDPTDRVRVIMLARKTKLEDDFVQQIRKLCLDRDSVVRASAVAALGEFGGVAVEQELIQALDDPDPRVQANAVEALEALNPPDLFQLIESKLASPNNRIRANAIKAILKPQYTLALRVLFSMLDHPDPTFRQSALWAVTETAPWFLAAKVNKLVSEDPDPHVRALAAKAMDALIKSWKSDNTEEKPTELAGSGV